MKQSRGQGQGPFPSSALLGDPRGPRPAWHCLPQPLQSPLLFCHPLCPSLRDTHLQTRAASAPSKCCPSEWCWPPALRGAIHRACANRGATPSVTPGYLSPGRRLRKRPPACGWAGVLLGVTWVFPAVSPSLALVGAGRTPQAPWHLMALEESQGGGLHGHHVLLHEGHRSHWTLQGGGTHGPPPGDPWVLGAGDWPLSAHQHPPVLYWGEVRVEQWEDWDSW